MKVDVCPSPKGVGVREALSAAAKRLESVSDTPRLDAELLMSHALGVSREAMLLLRLDDGVPQAFDAFLARRLAHEPVAYITGTRDFWTISLSVSPAVLIPRPDSETLIEAAVEHFGAAGPKTVLDLGTGSGALLLAALSEWPEARGLGIDASKTALDVAAGNAQGLGLAERAEFRLSNWADDVSGRFELILCNPPYIEGNAVLPPSVDGFEPHSALFAGVEGLDDYRILIPQIARLAAPGGMIAVEIGSTQGEAVSALFRQAGLSSQIRKDLGGRDRAILHFALGKAGKAG